MTYSQEDGAGREEVGWGEKSVHLYISAKAEESKRQMELTGKGKPQSKHHQSELMNTEMFWYGA